MRCVKMRSIVQSLCLLQIGILTFWAGLSKANEDGPDLRNLTENEKTYVQSYWNYNPRERIIPANDNNARTSYRFAIPPAERLAGITYVGHAARLRMVLERARNGEALRIGALGGSITTGHGVGGGEFVYFQHFMDWLNAAMPPRPASQGGEDGAEEAVGDGGGAWDREGAADGREAQPGAGGASSGGGSAGLWRQRRQRALLGRAGKHKFLNGAVPGTQSGYTSSCLTNHLIPGADLVFVEFAVNDSPVCSWGEEDTPRRPLERLFRKLLRLPSRPAVVLVNMYAAGLARGVYWYSAERDFSEFATYYGLPSVSLKAAVMPSPAEEVSQNVIYTGGHNHPGRGGHVVITELIITLLLDLLQLNTAEHTAGVIAASAGAADGAAISGGDGGGGGGGSVMLEDLSALAARPLPPPIFPGNFGAAIDTCYIEDQLQGLVQQPVEGWEWTDEGRGKWGYVALQPNRTLRIKVSTLVGGGGADGVNPDPSQEQEQELAPIVLQISYLQSYCGMGTAVLVCVSGCRCQPVTIDAYDHRQVSVATTTDAKVTQHPECVLQLTTDRPSKAAVRAARNATNAAACRRGVSTGGGGGGGGGAGGGRVDPAAWYKFKVMGLVVGEDPGASEGTVTFVRGNSADILKRVQAFGRAHGTGRGSAGGADPAGGGGGSK